MTDATTTLTLTAGTKRYPCGRNGHNQLPVQVQIVIVRLKREHPSWGAPKIGEKLRRLHDDVQTPAISTLHAVLDRHGLVSRGQRRRYKAQGTSLSVETAF